MKQKPIMHLPHLPKLLLQHDASPVIGDQLEHEFLKAAAAGLLHCCVHPRGTDVAIALGQRLVILRGLRDPAGGAALHFQDATEAPEAISAVAWLASASSPDACVLVGTSLGFLQLHAADGQLLHRQELHDRAATSISVRWSGSGIDPDDASEDVTVSFEDAASRLPSFDVWAVVRWHLRNRSGGGWWGAGAAQTLSPTKFEYRSTGPRVVAACCGAAAPSLYALLCQRQEPAKFVVFTAGSKPPLASFLVEEDPAPGLMSYVSGLVRSYAPRRAGGGGGGGDAHSAPASPGGGKAKARERILGTRVSQDAAVWDDDKRRVTSVALSPCCRWAACCDTLGRVMLVDVGSTRVLRVLKGYRDAQVAWLVAPNPGAPASDALCLVVFAPRRRVVEVWRSHGGVRLGTLGQAPQRGVLLAQAALPQAWGAGAAQPGGGTAQQRRRFQPNACWMLDLDSLQLQDLTPGLLKATGCCSGSA